MVAAPTESGIRLLAHRLGKTVPVSALRMRLQRLSRQYPADRAETLEDWLVDLANTRQARIVFRPDTRGITGAVPDRNSVTDEELVVALCQLQCIDHPQILRLASQLVSRGALDPRRLIQTAVRERAQCVLAELARQALRVEPSHALWLAIQQAFPSEPPPREPLLHWTRLARAEPVDGKYNVKRWTLVA